MYNQNKILKNAQERLYIAIRVSKSYSNYIFSDAFQMVVCIYISTYNKPLSAPHWSIVFLYCRPLSASLSQLLVLQLQLQLRQEGLILVMSRLIF